MMKILIVEDNARLSERIKTMLGKLYVVDTVFTGEEAINQVSLISYNLIILDLNLPDMNGSKVCSSIRSMKISSPILVLTAIDDMKTKVDLLEGGADDYIVKPFSGAELLARSAALIRRQSHTRLNETLIVSDLELNISSRQVRRSGKLIDLRRKEFDILEYLVSNRGRAVTREMIINHAWDDTTESWNNTVDAHIKHIRDKVDRPFNKSLIKTAYGVGYKIDEE